MNRWLLLTLLFVIVGTVLIFPPISAESEEEIEKENKTYHDQKYPQLAKMKSHEIGKYTLAVLHIVCEMINASHPAERNTTRWKTVYYPKVDEFTELRGNFTQSLVMVPGVSVRVWLEFPAFDIRSESRIMLYNYNISKSEDYELLVGSRAITVVMEQGVVVDMYWDDSCTACSEQYCLEGSCSSVISQISPPCHDQFALAEDPFRCGLKIYVAWRGTDNLNQTLNSYTSVPSRFQKYSYIASAYDTAAGFTSDFLSFWKQPLN